MKKRSFIKILLLLFCILININFLYATESKMYYLVNVHEDGTRDNLDIAVTSIKQTDDLFEKGNKIKNRNRSMQEGTLAIAENVWTGPIVRAEYALLDVNGYQNFTSADGGGLDTYVNLNGNASSYYDAAYVETVNHNGVIKYKALLSGKLGYITRNLAGNSASGTTEVVPLSQVKSPSYYEVKGSELLRRYSVNILANNSYYAPIPIGVAPEGLKDGKYYSYDGNYFYTNLESLLDDAKENTHKRAVNKDKPYYNYYQYLSVRSRTNLTADDFNSYIDSKINNAQSKMKGMGQAFIKQGTDYTVNPAILFAIACNESAYGKSNIALTKNNLFGLKVMDTSTGSGYSYNSVEECIKDMSKIHISAGYCDVIGDSRYAGTFAGNKDSGINVKYASDPYWGEKIASHYYQVDKRSGFKDYGKYKIGVKRDYTTINVRKTSNFEYSPVYKMKNRGRDIKNLAIIIDSESTGQMAEGSTKWYKFRSETILDKNKNTVDLYDPNIYKNMVYNYDDPFLYVHSKYMYITNSKIGCSHSYEKQNKAPTCTEDGYEKEICKKCGHVNKDTLLAKLGHDMSKVEVIKKETCKEEGLKKVSCSRCNHQVEEKIPKNNNHTFTEKIIEATCTTPKEKIKTCTVCNKEEKTKISDALGHKFSDWVIDKNPGEFTDGSKHRVCERCKHKETSIIPSLGKYEEVEGEIYLESFNYNTNTNKLDVNGYLAIRRINNHNKEYKIEFRNKKTNERIFKKLEAQTSGYPYEIPDMDGVSIKESWFKGSVDISDIKQGDYEIYIIATQENKMARNILSNYYSKNIMKKATYKNRGYTFETNFYKRTVPIEMTVRENGLISKLNPPTSDDMYNYSRLTEFKENKLRIRGCSFNVGGDYSKNVDVKRELILENQDTYERYNYNISYIDNGDYEIRLNIPDGKDKTRAWFDASIDIGNLPKGTYSIHIRTMVNGIDDSSRINDAFNPDLSSQKLSLNGKNYSLRINENEKYTIELIVN